MCMADMSYDEIGGRYSDELMKDRRCPVHPDVRLYLSPMSGFIYPCVICRDIKFSEHLQQKYGLSAESAETLRDEMDIKFGYH